MKPQFVTALYVGLEGTRFNGNSRGIYDRYRESLKSLADGGYAIVCYTSSELFEELTEYFKDNKNLELRISELKDYKLHPFIEEIKNQHPKYITDDAWRSRCVEIMWGKFSWLLNHIEDLEDDDSLFWIDAGIFHGGLITNNFRSDKSKGFYDFDKITQQRNLHADLVRFAGDKILNIRSQSVNHGSDDYKVVFETDVSPQYGIIGGIFGGKKDRLLKYIEAFLIGATQTISKQRLLKEEEIMYFINEKFPSWFKEFHFTSWYHEDWIQYGLFDPKTQIALSDFFKVIRE